MKERIFLIGFMGTGKTTIGAALAGRMGWALFDSDHEIVKREGRDIPAIFAAEGEAYFRQVEAQVLLDLSCETRAVITTGGGAILLEQNRTLLQQTGHLVCLRATVDEIVRRVSSDQNRPLLQVDDVRARIEHLKKERAGLYDFAELTLDTTEREIDGIVEEITRELTASMR